MYISNTSILLEKIQVVNSMLLSIGSSKVDDLDTDHPDVEIALRILEEEHRRCQYTQWWFNTDYDIELKPNDREEIVISNNIINILPENKNYIVRGNKLYDRYNQTYKIKSNVRIRTLNTFIEWEDCPFELLDYIQYKAQIEFITQLTADYNKVDRIQQLMAGALVRLKAKNIAEHQYQSIDNDHYKDIAYRTRPYNNGYRGY